MPLIESVVECFELTCDGSDGLLGEDRDLRQLVDLLREERVIENEGVTTLGFGQKKRRGVHPDSCQVRRRVQNQTEILMILHGHPDK
jgi:gamma-glutamyl:cysteine ligase YbdK (ATP-grasp superfamily)